MNGSRNVAINVTSQMISAATNQVDNPSTFNPSDTIDGDDERHERAQQARDRGQHRRPPIRRLRDQRRQQRLHHREDEHHDDERTRVDRQSVNKETSDDESDSHRDDVNREPNQETDHSRSLAPEMIRFTLIRASRN